MIPLFLDSEKRVGFANIFKTRKRDDADDLTTALAKIGTLQPSGETARNWGQVTTHQAWFDRPDAIEAVVKKKRAGQITSAQATILEKWVRDGYIVLNNAIPESDIDELNAFVENLFTTDSANDDITLLGFTADPEKGGAAVPHRDIVHLSPEERQARARLSPWRIHELWTQCAAAERIYRNASLTEIASLIFDRQAYPRSTINFYLGSQQELHQDMTVFHVFPGNYLIGAWIALEDISADSGPLRYAPRTHLAPPYEGFPNHPQTTLRTCPLSEYPGYYNYTNRLADEQGGAKAFLAKKGDVFLWHGMLVHGGSPVNNPELTRKSMVIHYLTDGVDQTDKIVGPFNWG